jgi:hypothetical protein
MPVRSNIANLEHADLPQRLLIAEFNQYARHATLISAQLCMTLAKRRASPGLPAI